MVGHRSVQAFWIAAIHAGMTKFFSPLLKNLANQEQPWVGEGLHDNALSSQQNYCDLTHHPHTDGMKFVVKKLLCQYVG
jgi:hypothetical protein